MNPFCLFLLKLACLIFGCVIYVLQRYLDKGAIAEVGYRSLNWKKYRKAAHKYPLWDRVLLWSLFRNAKRNRKAVCVYFGLHILACVGLLGSAALFLWPVNPEAWRDAIQFQLRFPLGVLIVHTGLRIVLDLIFLPSEQKRYGVKKPNDQE